MPNNAVCKCPACNKNVTKTMKSVSCAYCGEYYHLKCGKISEEQYQFLIKNKILKFICQTCERVPKRCKVQEDLRNGFMSMMTQMEKEMETRFQEQKRQLEEHFDSGLKAMEAKFENFFNTHNGNNGDCDIKSDLKNCYNMIKHVDDIANQKIHSLEIKNSILQRRLNRSDIIIKGLPKYIKNLRKPIIKIASLCNVCIYYSDIQHCTYFNGGKSVIVKFNSVQIRDAIMINYRRNIKIKVKDIVGGNANSNVFLNDHLTPSAKELIAVCKNLKLAGKIKKYSYKNYDVPKAKIFLLDGSVKVLNFEECVSMLDENSGSCSYSNRLSGSSSTSNRSSVS